MRATERGLTSQDWKMGSRPRWLGGQAVMAE